MTVMHPIALLNFIIPQINPFPLMDGRYSIALPQTATNPLPGRNKISVAPIEAQGLLSDSIAAVTDTANVAYQVPAGQSQWDIALHNKGVSVALMSNQTLLTSNNVMEADGFCGLGCRQRKRRL